jgi:2-succinyl-6-hydroxy-2,4-cyclohexadiene-1-carboxylate synthase
MRYLLLHGFTGAPESFAGLGAPEGSVTPVLGGHLGTPALGSYWDEVERLAALGADCDGLFGYSLGGRLALGILSRYPARFRRCVIVSAHPGLKTDAERDQRREGDARFVRVLHEQGLEAFVDRWQALPLWASQQELSDSARRAQRELRLRHTAAGLAASLIQHGLGEMPDLRPYLAHVSGDVRLLTGASDTKFVELSSELSRIIPAAQHSVVPAAGHNLLLERPALCRELLSMP